jgi:hypothetical protein
MYEEKNTIHRSRQMAAEIEEFGRNILGNLSSQRELLEVLSVRFHREFVC